MHQRSKNNYPFSARAGASCTTMRVGGRLGHVLVCVDSEDPGRFYCRGKTGPNTDFLKNGYPIISLFRTAQRAQAPLGDW
jgi:hypothetical protein